MECLKQVVKSRQIELMPANSGKLAEKRKRAERDIEIINANAERLNGEAEENLLFQAVR